MPSPCDTLLIQYRYDPLDRLLTCTPANQASHQRFYQKDRLATEIHGVISHSIFQQEDLLLAQQQHQGTTTDTTLLATDHQRSVLHVLDKTQRQAIAYSPYGHRAPTNGLLSLLGFNGERADPVTGHYLLGNGYRAFNPVLMRFNSPDSWSPFGKGGWNVYLYCKSAPMTLRDDTGHSPFSSWIRTLTSTSFDASMATRFSTRRPWQIIPQHIDTTGDPARRLVMSSIDRYQPTTKRLLTSAENAIQHAKIIGYKGKKISAVIEAKNELITHISNKNAIIDESLENISYDSVSFSSSKSNPGSTARDPRPIALKIAQEKYDAQHEHYSFNVAFKTYELNRKLLRTLNTTPTDIRQNQKI